MAILSELLNDARFMIKIRSTLMKRQKELDRQAPRLGDMAPDFTLYDIAGTESVTLSGFRGKRPVALIFGSFT